MIGPAVVLAAIFASFHTSAYVFVRGRVGARLPLVLVAAFLGAWAGDALAGALGVDPIRIGDFHVLAASAVAWIGIGFVALISVMAPARRVAAASSATTTSTATTSREPLSPR
ncbi:MAG TPA: hypothetical protein VKR30_08715 [Candidatus Limnocylindrales bacterium]|nr:hypothetical protein [Candidatus Limnocylindrales bacterium]